MKWGPVTIREEQTYSVKVRTRMVKKLVEKSREVKEEEDRKTRPEETETDKQLNSLLRMASTRCVALRGGAVGQPAQVS